MPTPAQHIDQLQTELEFTRGNYKQLLSKVKEVLAAQEAYRKGNKKDHELKAMWAKENELKAMLNPNKASQSTINWRAQ